MNMAISIEKLEDTLSEIKRIGPSKGRKIITNYDNLVDNLQLMVKVKAVSSELEKAQKYYINDQEKIEKNFLFNAYCTVQENNISDADLETAKLQDYTTGNSLTRAGIERRLAELGWKG